MGPIGMAGAGAGMGGMAGEAAGMGGTAASAGAAGMGGMGTRQNMGSMMGGGGVGRGRPELNQGLGCACHEPRTA